MQTRGGWRYGLIMLTLAGATCAARAAEPAYVGRWALTIPGGGAGWLGIVEENGRLSGSILWGGGSVVPVDEVRVAEGTLVVTRNYEREQNGPDGKKQKVREVETLRGTLDGDTLNLTTERAGPDGKASGRTPFSGRRSAALPPAPDLAKVTFGAPVALFNGTDLAGWRLTNPGQASGWSIRDGVLSNRPVQEPGKPHKSYGNLRTEQEFEDFNLKLETRVPPGGNSGVYLRGIYEVQVAESFGKAPEAHMMSAIYSRIAPSENAAKPANEWQTLDITLVDRHVTVILNGKKVIDNQPLLGCTGGALWSDEFRPGPLYLQGDHTDVDYRNMVIRPVQK